MIEKLAIIKCCRKGVIGLIVFVSVLAVFLFTEQASAGVDLELNGKPIRVSGYINQGVSFGLSGDHADTQEGFQQAPFQFLLETQYDVMYNLRVFLSGKISTDWAYDFLSDDSDWSKKDFKKSRDELYFLDKWNDILNEAHITWTPGNWNFRIGKQIILWGEMDNVAVTSVIMPSDGRRGVTDQEFEAFFLPITLLKAEYYFPISNEWLNDLGVEVVFNPNLKFRGNEGYSFGRNVSSIWAPHVPVGPDTILGEYYSDIEEPVPLTATGLSTEFG